MSSGRPLLSVKEASAIVRELYGFEPNTVKELVSYSDRNFLVEGRVSGPTASTDPQTNGERLLLKISGYEERKSSFVLSVHNRLLLHLHEKNIHVQKPLYSLRNRLLEELNFPEFKGHPNPTRLHVVRLMTFIRGHTWRSLVPLDSARYRRMGEFLATLHLELREFLMKNITGESIRALQENNWTLTNAPMALTHLDSIQNQDNRELARSVLQDFKQNYAIRLIVTHWDPTVTDPEFPIALIHGDPNHTNLLVEPDYTSGSHEFGMIDWEDCAISRRIYDLALMLTYMMTCEPMDSPTTVLGRELILGYQAVASINGWALTEKEIGSLPTLVATRFAQSLVLGQYSYMTNPDNEHTLDTTRCNGWQKLSLIWRDENEKYSKAWRP